MKPSVGRIVIVRTPTMHNGSNEHPAIINRVWGSEDPASAHGVHVCINVTVFPDCGEPFFMTSVPLYETKMEALSGGFGSPCWWPERV
jgi:hypothetical protein